MTIVLHFLGIVLYSVGMFCFMCAGFASSKDDTGAVIIFFMIVGVLAHAACVGVLLN